MRERQSVFSSRNGRSKQFIYIYMYICFIYTHTHRFLSTFVSYKNSVSKVSSSFFFKKRPLKWPEELKVGS